MGLLVIAAITLIASFVGTVTGFGISLLMMPVLLLTYPLPETLLFAGIIHWFDNIWKMFFFHKGIRWRLILVFGFAGAIGGYAGAKLSFEVAEQVLTKGVALFILAYLVFLAFRPRWKLRHTDANAAVGGGASGFMAGIIGLGGALRSVFLSAYDLPKAVYLFTVGAVATMTDTTRIWTYWSGGTRLDSALTTALIVCIPLSLVGAWLGKIMVDKIPQTLFRSVVAVFLLIVAVQLLFVS